LNFIDTQGRLFDALYDIVFAYLYWTQLELFKDTLGPTTE